MRVLITGAGGFIGSQVARKVLQDGHSVAAVLRPGESSERLIDCSDSVSVFHCDLYDGIATRQLVSETRPESALHLAWYAEPGKYWEARENLDCVRMSLCLAQALAEAGCSRFVGAGTCAEYDWDYGFLSENVTPLKPRSLYGVCKNATREILQAFCARAGMDFAWTRFFLLYGPMEAEERLIPYVVLTLLKGEVAKCTRGEQRRDFLYVEDAASAMWAVAKSDLSGPVNVGSGQPIKVRTLVETVAQHLQREDNVVFGALPTDPQEPALVLADVRRLKNGTGWKPSLSLQEGVEKTCEWWRSRIGVERPT
jgi:nucleoside-diphosphate-sugar epimerase